MVGFGGRSSYMALLSFYAFPVGEIHVVSLLCNIIVVSGSAHVYMKKHMPEWRRVLPMVLISIPFYFIGAALKFTHSNLYMLLGVNLIIVSVVLWVRTKSNETYTAAKGGTLNVLADGLIGGYIGFLSSLLGMGGGIFLAPLLNFRKWDNPKKIATLAAIFVFTNSICSMVQVVGDIPQVVDYQRTIALSVAVLAGGQIGARLGVYRLSVAMIRRVTAFLVFLAGLEVLSRHLPVF